MKYFFWLSAALYVAVYFYAAWIYDGFSMPVAIIIFAMVVGFFYWRYKRYQTVQAEQKLASHSTSNHIDRKPLSLWRSPIPYIGIAALVVIFIGMRL